MESPSPSPSPESIFLEDFGQKVDLTRRIREVLLNYPEGTTVLKELIQNADDAGATTVRLCLDRRLHGSDSLLSKALAPWQGPLLLAYNDAVFTEEDFVSISRIGGSSKHGQASKTGRFGVGQAFCCLLLRVRTGLSVQVNGYFEVSSNRRGIWYGADMDRSGKIRSVWNRLLLEDVVAPAFTQLLLGIRGLLESRKLYYSLWPSGSFEEPWNILVEHIYRNISNAPVLYSEIEGGKWVSPVEAFLHDQEVTKSKELGEALIELGMPIVGLPNNLFDMLLKYASTVRQKVVTPDTVRCFLRECRLLSSLGKAYKLVLLEYCLEDLLDADVGTHAYNLPLLPLANGEFGLLSDKVQGVLVKIGCKILNPNYGVEHSDLFHYVSDGNATGLVKSIYDVVSLNCGTIETCFHSLEAEERDELRSFLLDPKWYFGDCLNESAIQNCKRLPIYKVYGGGSTQRLPYKILCEVKEKCS
ncbi:hypothetical protein ACLB2K_055496 [Fragaria x ananassa]